LGRPRRLSTWEPSWLGSTAGGCFWSTWILRAMRPPAWKVMAPGIPRHRSIPALPASRRNERASWIGILKANLGLDNAASGYNMGPAYGRQGPIGPFRHFRSEETATKLNLSDIESMGIPTTGLSMPGNHTTLLRKRIAEGGAPGSCRKPLRGGLAGADGARQDRDG